MRKILTTQEQLKKLSALHALADKGRSSPKPLERLGALALDAGFVDFLVIEAARLLEQIILKGRVASSGPPGFVPHDEQYFYDKQISTRDILKEIKKFLPFEAPNTEGKLEAERITKLAGAMVEKGLSFLNYRNSLLHHIGSPKTPYDKVFELCDKAIAAYEEFLVAHRDYFEAAAPYRFSEDEMRLFYGPVN
jgi:hypothetical protein